MRLGKTAIIVAVVSALVAIGGGAAAQLFLQPDSDGTKPVVDNRPPVFLDLEPLVANLKPDEEGRFVQVVMHLKVPDQKTADRVKQHMPEVRHLLLTLLSDKRAEQISTGADKAALGREVTERVNRALALPQGSRVTGTMFSAFLVQ